MKYIRFDKLRIALDVDSVLADVIIHWNRIYYDIYNRKLKKFDINTWDFWKKLNLNNQQFNEIFTKTWKQWEQIPPTEENLSKKISELYKLGVVDIVTGRSLETVSQVKEWLNREKIFYNKFIHVPSESFKCDLPYDIFIDDSPFNIIKNTEKNKYSLLYNQPWNQNIDKHPNIFRITNLNEAIKIIKKLKSQRKIL